ncbi:MAG: hypothetical protein CMK36_04360 [Porticoccaceae bacterium]|nr:hypothetical protein [Porticoccaceae bacterium]
MIFLSYFARSVFLIFWLIFFLNFFMPLVGHWSLTVTCAGLLLSTLHFSEFVVVQRSPEPIRRSTIIDVMSVLLFGSSYWLPLLEKRDLIESAIDSLPEDSIIDKK